MASKDNKFEIRAVERKDMPRLIELCGAHAAYENATFDASSKSEKLSHYFFEGNPSIICWVVDFEDTVEGYMVLSPEFSTWDADYYFHMDCLYLTEKCRGLGIGSEILMLIKYFARENGIKLIQWQTPVENKRAIKFYKTNGAIPKEKVRFYLDVEQ
ncbi:GNAT family N-acetyltransferase [Aquiflexum lacus]|uniref:GNAT family N-acetyltransferase n=1 Tax=Aquiflexum lacus TaxID=2483805 RepID=UPI0018930652|nr:GNAT family N-acetyltransferase [Aquiflexum lacus]